MRGAALLAAVLAFAPLNAPAAVFVASQDGGTVTRLDGAAGAPPMAVGPGPAGLAPAPDGTLYLTHPDQRTITAVEARSGRVLRRMPFPGQPFGIAVSQDGRTLFVGDWQGARLVRIDASSGAVEAEAALAREPAGLVRDAGARLFVAERGSDSVAVVDGATMRLVARIAVGRAPFALALSPDGRRLYVGNVRSNDLTAIDTGTLTVAATRPAGRSPYGVAVSDGRILVTNQESGSVSVLATDLTLTGTVPVGRYPEGIAVADGRAYVANWFSDDVSVIDLAAMREVARIKVPGGPRSVLALPAAGPGGGR